MVFANHMYYVEFLVDMHGDDAILIQSKQTFQRVY